MPRKGRQKSESGIYHIMLRGVNQQGIFSEPVETDEYVFAVMD